MVFDSCIDTVHEIVCYSSLLFGVIMLLADLIVSLSEERKPYIIAMFNFKYYYNKYFRKCKQDNQIISINDINVVELVNDSNYVEHINNVFINIIKKFKDMDFIERQYMMNKGAMEVTPTSVNLFYQKSRYYSINYYFSKIRNNKLCLDYIKQELDGVKFKDFYCKYKKIKVSKK